jgi:hypothetical protein
MSEMNEGVKIILARMETNPEDFFTVHKEYNPWRWIFDDSVREVMTEPEKAALFEGIKKVRRLMITHKALEAVMPKDEGEIGHIPPPPWGIAKQGASGQGLWGSDIALTAQEIQKEQMKLEHMAEQRMKMQQAATQQMQDQQNALLQSQPNPYQNAYQNVGSGGTLSVGGEILDSSILKKLKNLVK